MDHRWYKEHRKNKAERDKQLNSFKTAFEELTKILEEEFKKPSNRKYDEPGWMQKQIATNEYNACLADIIKLINFKD